MFKSCLGLSKSNTEQYESDKIVKAHAFNTNILPTRVKYETYYCNEVELLKLKYLGPLRANFNSIKYCFGQPQRFDCYKGKFSFEYVWYINFNDGTKCAIVKKFKNMYEPRHNDSWKIYGSSDTIMRHIILLFL